MKRTLVIVAAVAVVAALAGPAFGRAGSGRKAAAKSYVLTSSLSAENVPQSQPANTEAAGTFTARLTLEGTSGTISWRLDYAHLGGPVTAAVHLGRPGETGEVALPLCSPCRRHSHGSFSGPFGGQKKLLAKLFDGRAYVDAGGTAGEIRGQLGKWLEYTKATHRAAVTLVGALGTENSGYNFDGYDSGALTIGVPRGWKVSVDCSNEGADPHSCAIVESLKATTPAFKGAAIAHPVQGLAKGRLERFHFTATRVGSYRIVCLVPGHEPAGMWDVFRVTRKGVPTVSVKPSQAT